MRAEVNVKIISALLRKVSHRKDGTLPRSMFVWGKMHVEHFRVLVRAQPRTTLHTVAEVDFGLEADLNPSTPDLFSARCSVDSDY